MDALGAERDWRDSCWGFGVGDSEGSGSVSALGVAFSSGSTKGAFFLWRRDLAGVVLAWAVSSSVGVGVAVGVGVGVGSSSCSTTGGLCLDFRVGVRARRVLVRKQPASRQAIICEDAVEEGCFFIMPVRASLLDWIGG